MKKFGTFRLILFSVCTLHTKRYLMEQNALVSWSWRVEVLLIALLYKFKLVFVVFIVSLD